MEIGWYSLCLCLLYLCSIFLTVLLAYINGTVWFVRIPQMRLWPMNKFIPPSCSPNPASVFVSVALGLSHSCIVFRGINMQEFHLPILWLTSTWFDSSYLLLWKWCREHVTCDFIFCWVNTQDSNRCVRRHLNKFSRHCQRLQSVGPVCTCSRSVHGFQLLPVPTNTWHDQFFC